jgi:hypothetical protein
MAKKQDCLRRHPRSGQAGRVRIGWETASGTQSCLGRITDVSESGLGVEIWAVLPMRTPVMVQAESLRLHDSATVKHSSRIATGYRVGLELNCTVDRRAFFSMPVNQ